MGIRSPTLSIVVMSSSMSVRQASSIPLSPVLTARRRIKLRHRAARNHENVAKGGSCRRRRAMISGVRTVDEQGARLTRERSKDVAVS